MIISMRSTSMPLWVIVLLLLSVSAASAQNNIQVRGLFKGSAVLEVDGKQQLLKVGSTSAEGVSLLAADPSKAVIEVNGEQRTLGLSKLINSSYQITEKREIPVSSHRGFSLSRRWITSFICFSRLVHPFRSCHSRCICYYLGPCEFDKPPTFCPFVSDFLSKLLAKNQPFKPVQELAYSIHLCRSHCSNRFDGRHNH